MNPIVRSDSSLRRTQSFFYSRGGQRYYTGLLQDLGLKTLKETKRKQLLVYENLSDFTQHVVYEQVTGDHDVRMNDHS